MGIEQEYVSVIYCDGHEDDDEGVVFEGAFGETHWEYDEDGIREARADGWEITDGRRGQVWCPDCVAKRKRAELGMSPEPPVEIPGQLDMFAVAAPGVTT